MGRRVRTWRATLLYGLNVTPAPPRTAAKPGLMLQAHLKQQPPCSTVAKCTVAGKRKVLLHGATKMSSTARCNKPHCSGVQRSWRYITTVQMNVVHCSLKGWSASAAELKMSSVFGAKVLPYVPLVGSHVLQPLILWAVSHGHSST